ncbi:MGH1-like glycoside hydrolase domain-containing protein [Simkania negevensis]|uniref:Uncharacterized protein YMR196W n=1 Tax=Simkania negevensis (strain ATCC VR-1471 / DSM 27360 / Z) TaxID=331113 RepID=F8L5L0_SIMNZ|nr:glucosidase [Simkania negevensis]CCB89664.1 uncharacterized protein YMR196W [Simkania negevensis Z]
MDSVEHKRLKNSSGRENPPWRKWGPYVAERSWATVREDYSWNGDAWGYFPFEQAHKKVYRWGEDGIAGWCDRYQTLVFSPAFWNGKDPILKERLFGLAGPEGNHGEDVKEYYYYLDGTPTHSYMKYLYKYPHAAFPYEALKKENRERGVQQEEYELVDTGVLDKQNYFDIFIEYAKGDTEDTCIKIEAINRGEKAASLHIVPQLWFRNQWRWEKGEVPKPILQKGLQGNYIVADDSAMPSPPSLTFDYHLGKRYLYASEGGKPLFTENENRAPDMPFSKEGFHEAIVEGKKSVNPEEKGTKGCFHYIFEIPAGKSAVVYLRLTDQEMKNPMADVEKIFAQRKKEADEFYEQILPEEATDEEKMIERQALAGLLWNKQIYIFDVNKWLEGDTAFEPAPETRHNLRNLHWRHLNSMRIISMPDKWEYPWFAAWDLAFHCVALALVDIEFAKEELWLLLFDQFQHPNGAIPAYEWEFSDLNPPIQAWATLRIFQMQREKEGVGDFEFLKKCYLKLLMNFSWWTNRVDSSGFNVFEGGFLGLDNITIVDRSLEAEGGATLRQSDGTGWMAFFTLNLMRISLELAKTDGTYESMATKFFQHFIYIAHAMKIRDNKHYEMWSEKDGFFYDVLCYPNGTFSKFRIRSLVGIIPLYATEVITEEDLKQFPKFKQNFFWFLKNQQKLTKGHVLYFEDSHLYFLTLVEPEQLKRVLQYVWDPEEFRSEYGLRSLSKFHEKHPFFYKDKNIGYEPGHSLVQLKGGNSNWRGPIWFPTSYMLIQSLKSYAKVFKDEFKIGVKDEKPVSIEEMAEAFSEKLVSIFKKDSSGVRPFMGQNFPYSTDPNFNSHLFFYEFFHAETGRGLGASHQTGWTSLVANLIQELRDKKPRSKNG